MHTHTHTHTQARTAAVIPTRTLTVAEMQEGLTEEDIDESEPLFIPPPPTPPGIFFLFLFFLHFNPKK